MKVTVEGSVVHRCPFRDEIDFGTVEMRWNGAAPELHMLAAHLKSWRDIEITHEELTHRLAERFPGAVVTTRWVTAGLTMECHALPRHLPE